MEVGKGNRTERESDSKKNLLIYAHYYGDVAATAQLLQELAEGMLNTFNITVICVVPSYLGKVEDRYRKQKIYYEELNGVKIVRTLATRLLCFHS